MTLTTHHLTFTATAQTPLELDGQAGSQVRGALIGALWGRFCTNQAAPTCADCPLLERCPVAQLIAPMRAAPSLGGEQQRRPYVLRPPQPRRYQVGEQFDFGLGLFGTSTASLFPYLAMAAQQIGEHGMGRPLGVNAGRRGQLQLRAITAINPLNGASEPLYTGDQRVRRPALPVSSADVVAYASQLSTTQIMLTLHTPLRLVEQQHLVRRFAVRPFLQRLEERVREISTTYGDLAIGMPRDSLLAVAEAIRTDDATRWVDIVSYSSRTGGRTPIGGLVGHVTLHGDLTAIRELLVWGSLLHVGKNAVKGDGWFTVSA